MNSYSVTSVKDHFSLLLKVQSLKILSEDSNLAGLMTLWHLGKELRLPYQEF